MLIVFLFIISFFINTDTIYAQALKGRVVGADTETLPGATVQWMFTSKGVFTDAEGKFYLPDSGVTVEKIIVRYTGYKTDTIKIRNRNYIEIQLKENLSLSEIQIIENSSGIILLNGPDKTEQITRTELQKSACCDMAGCFETQSSVQPQVTNVLTNSKELRILGLSGVYNQLLFNGMPVFQGLSYTYGINGIPGTLVNNIYVSKGANSVLQGYESISGQINVETLDPVRADKFLLNIYGNSFSEKHLNVNFAWKLRKWNALSVFHTAQPGFRSDRDQDRLLDLPLLKRYSGHQVFSYGNSKEWGWSHNMSFRYVYEARTGGQTSFQPDKHTGSQTIYGQQIQYAQPEIMLKSLYRFNAKHALGFFAAGYYHSQDSWFGTASYSAKQSYVFTNVQHEFKYGKNNTLKSGMSYRHMDIREQIGFQEILPVRTYAGLYARTENIPGVFAENTLHLYKDKLIWTGGIRVDYFEPEGVKFVPRMMLKYELRPGTDFRFNVGRGWRTVNIFSENINLLSSSRNVLMPEKLNSEKAWNSGFSLVQKFGVDNPKFTGHISLDYYYTLFQNQVFPDYNTLSASAIVQNFEGKSTAHAFQADIFLTLYKRWEIKSGFNFLEAAQFTSTGKNILPFNPRYKILGTLSYKPLSNRFHIDMNTHWIGKQKLPGTSQNPPMYQIPNESETYVIVSIQFTWNVRRFELYSGCENITDFRQLRPALSWQDPFSPWFDTSVVWGPTRGREVYAGFRYRIKK